MGLSYIGGGGYALPMDKLTHRDVLAMMEPAGYLEKHGFPSKSPLRFFFHHGRPQWASEDKAPCVYAWVVRAETDDPEIIYIGKAGKGLVARCRQHEQGFRGKDGKGKSNGDELIKCIEAGRVEVWAIWPEAVQFSRLLKNGLALPAGGDSSRMKR